MMNGHGSVERFYVYVLRVRVCFVCTCMRLCACACVDFVIVMDSFFRVFLFYTWEEK